MGIREQCKEAKHETALQQGDFLKLSLIDERICGRATMRAGGRCVTQQVIHLQEPVTGCGKQCICVVRSAAEVMCPK